MRRFTLIALALASSACSLIVGPGSKYLDGSAPPIDAGDFDGGDLDGGARDGALPDGASPDGGTTDPLPPIGSGVGLSDFQPVPDQVLTAVVGPYTDPNGDSVTVSIQWTRNGTALPGQTARTLDLAAVGASATEEFGVEVTFSDGTLTSMITAGPATVVDDDETRWRMLFPPRGPHANGGLGIFDARRQRLLFHALSEEGTPYGMWEHQLPASTSDDGRWVRVAASGPEPTAAGSVIADPARDRLLFFGGRTRGGPSNELFVFDMSGSQGTERWAEIFATGDAPSPRSAEARLRFTNPDGEEVIFFYSGQDASDEAIDDGYLLHVEAADRWERVAAPLPPARLVPVLFYHSPTHRLFMAGGAVVADPPVALDEVWVWDLDDAPADGFTRVDGLTLPHAVFGGEAIVDGDSVRIYGGAQELLREGDVVINSDFIDIDLAAMTASATPASGLPGAPLVLGVPADPFSTSRIVFFRDFSRGGLHFYELPRGTDRFLPVSAEGVDLPPPLMQGQGMVDTRGLLLSNGKTSVENDEGIDGIYTFRDHHFEALATTGDTPGARWGAVADNSWQDGQNMAWFLGGSPDESMLSRSTWLLNRESTRWEAISVAIGESIPDGRVGHVMMRGVCGGPEGGVDRANVAGLFGGRLIGSGAISDEQWMGRCTVSGGPPRDCTFFTSYSTNRPGTVWSAVTTLSAPGAGDLRYAFMQGGAGAGGLTDTAFIHDVCDGPGFTRTWIEARQTGDRPPAMLGHSITAALDDASQQTRAYLLFGGLDENGDSTFDRVYRIEWNQQYFDPELSYTDVTVGGPERPTSRLFHVAAYDPAENRVLVYGGLDRGYLWDDLWELRVR